MCVCMYVGIYVCMYVCVCVCMNICIYVGMCVCMNVCRYVSIYVCMYVYMYVCTYLFIAIGLLPGGNGYFTYKRNLKLVTTRFKSGGLHEKHVVATWNVGNHLSICL